MRDVVLADFDDDGLLDVAALTTDAVQVRLGSETKTLFGPPTYYAGPGGAVDVTDADVNGDGFPDLLVVGQTAGEVRVLLADGRGRFRSDVDPVAVGSEPTAAEVADLDVDGDLDFAVTNSGSNTVSIRLGDGSGGFTHGPEVPVRSQPQDLTAADLNRDGFLDLVVGSNDDPAPERSTVALYDGSRGFAEAASYRTFMGILTVTALDWDGDAIPDIAVTTGRDGGFAVGLKGHLTIAAGGFGSDADRYVSNIGNRPTGVAVADLDGDGDQDIVSVWSAKFLAFVRNPLG